MRVAVIGTSNSIMTCGYTYGLTQSTKVTSVENFSMGGSVSLLASVTTRGVDFSKYDVCLLDFAVNEALFVGYISTDDMYSYERAIVGRLIAAGCLPVILILPRKRMGGARDLVKEHHIQLAQDLNLPYFDITSYLEKFTITKGIERATLFKDGGHLARWFAVALGHQIAEGLEVLLSRPVEFVNQSWTYDHYSMLKIARLLPKDARVHRSNSLYSFHVGRLTVGDSLQVNVAANTSVVGICANFGGSSGIMKLTGRSEVLIDARNGYQRQDRPLSSGFIMLTLALQKPISEMDGRYNIEVLPLQDIPEDKRRSAFQISPCPIYPPDLGTIELGSLILKGEKKKTNEKVPAPQLCVDLAKITKSTALEAAVDIFISHGVTFPKPDSTALLGSVAQSQRPAPVD